MNKKIKEILIHFLDKHIIVLGITFIVLLVPITMGLRELKIAIGIPDQSLTLDNKNSLLPDELITQNDFDSNWKFRDISTRQSIEQNDDKLLESAYRMFIGEYKNQSIILTYHIDHYIDDLNMIDERNAVWNSVSESDEYITIDMLETFYNPVLDIQTYCYTQHYLRQNEYETECRMYKIENQNLLEARLGFFDITDKSVYMEVIAEMERLME